MTVPRKIRLSALTFLALVIAGCFVAPLAFADTIMVTNSADAGPGTLRQAVADSVSGDTITFAIEDTNTIALTSGQLLITNDLSIVCSNAPILLDAGGLSRALEISFSNTVVIDSLIITNGNAEAGGGILLDDGATLTLTNCTLAGNISGAGGGIFISSDSTVAINHCLFSGNSATNDGGAIDNENYSTLIIDGSTLTGNSAQRGGAIFNDFGTNTLSHCQLLSNSAANGGAIDNDTNSVLTVDYSTFSFNVGTNYGGGIINTNGGTVMANNSTFSSNSCPADWAGGIDNWDTITLNNCTISGNYGTGFINTGGNAVCNNCTFSGNTAIFDGGGYYAYFGTNILNNCTICGNFANRRAGGMYENSSHSFVTNTIVAGNTALISTPDFLGSISGVNNFFGGNPLLAPLGNYGGPTQTMPPLGGSPVLNAGVDSVANFLTIDQRGEPRLADSHVDIGAVEIQPSMVVNTNDYGPGSFRDALASAAPLIVFTNTLSGQTIHLTNGQLTISNSVGINAGNLSAGIIIDAGGAARVLEITAGKSVVFDSLTITNGNADAGGGILVDDDVKVTLTNCVVTGNVAGSGGGISISTNGVVTIDRCTFSSNASISGSGGGVAQFSGVLTVNNSTASYNTSDENGGGFAISGGQATFNNCTLMGNAAGNSGGGICVGADVTNLLNNCTITGNSAGAGGGIYLDPQCSSLVFNSIVTGNIATSAPDIFGALNGANNLTNGNPLLAPLGNYGGPTQTMPPLFGSPAIDAGLDAAALTFTDQRGYTRFSGARVDIGAVEAQFIPAAIHPVLQLNRAMSGNGFNLIFGSVSNADFTILSSTNLALPANQWEILGPATQIFPGSYYFTDPVTNKAKARYYQVVSP